MNNPQERIIKKMIDNIVETNKPAFEKTPESPQASARGISSSTSTEELTVLARKIEYGFNSMRAENAELRKMLEEIAGAVKMLRNDMDGVRMTMQQTARGRDTSAPVSPVAMAPRASSGPATGAPQYRKTEADMAYETQSGNASHDEPAPQARGFAKKEDPADQIDIGKVFYYGKK